MCDIHYIDAITHHNKTRKVNIMTKTQTTKTASNNANISNWIDTLTSKRENWENGTYKASNEELYVLLDECVDLFKEVRAHRSLVKKLNPFSKNAIL